MTRCPTCNATGYTAPAAPLTPRQAALLSYLTDYIHEHGFAPTLGEICARMNITSLSTAHEMLTALQSKGRIVRTHNKPRAIRLVA